jgi:hypothetical protein
MDRPQKITSPKCVSKTEGRKNDNEAASWAASHVFTTINSIGLFQKAGGINCCAVSGGRCIANCTRWVKHLLSRRVTSRSVKPQHRKSATWGMSGRHGRSVGAAVVAAGPLGKHAGRRCDKQPAMQDRILVINSFSCLLIGGVRASPTDQANIRVETSCGRPLSALRSHEAMGMLGAQEVMMQVSYPLSAGNRHIQIFYAILDVH